MGRHADTSAGRGFSGLTPQVLIAVVVGAIVIWRVVGGRSPESPTPPPPPAVQDTPDCRAAGWERAARANGYQHPPPPSTEYERGTVP